MHQIGVGVLGPVFRTYDPDDDRLVALKAFHLDITPEQASTLADALNVIAQAGLSHPSLVTAVGAGLSDGVPYLALEYVVAESLDVAIRHYAPAEVGTALPWVVQLAEGLDAAHAVGLSHGALHLRDVFVTSALARVTGFGVVTALERVRLRGPLRRPYTAPEQIAGAEWGPAADRFALAAIAYELLTGKRAAGTGEQVIDRLGDVSGVRDAARLTRLFASALADRPEARPTSARLFADELADAVGWTGADVVRQALVMMESETGDPEHEGVDDAPAITAAGISARPSAGVETTWTEGAALTMARTNKPKNKQTTEPELDWTERALDRGESDELRESEAYQPRPPGAPPDVERAMRAEWDADPNHTPDFERMDAVLESASGDTPVSHEDYRGQEPAADQSRHGESRIPEDDDPDRTSSVVGARVESRAGEGGATGDRNAAERHDEQEPALDALDRGLDDDDADDDVNLSVIQARYRPADDRAESPSDSPGSQAAGAYEAITLSDLEDRLGDTADLPDDDPDDDADRGTDVAEGPKAWDDAPEARDDQTLMFESDGEDDYDQDGDDEGGLGVIASGWIDRARGLPVVPLAVFAAVITVVVLAVVFDWAPGGDAVVTDDQTTADGVVAGGLTEPANLPEPAAPAPQVSRTFSEATVAGSPVERPVEAPAEALPTPPVVEPAPEEPEIPDTAPVPAPAAAAEAPVASAAIAVPEPWPNGRLLVRSMPPGVRVAVNGEARGTTPLVLGELSYGVYDLQLSLEGYESQDHQLALSSDDPFGGINAELTRVAETRTASLGVGSVFVDTRPRGAEVWLDQQLVGETPMLIPNVSVGAHEVEFRNDGYRDWVTTVQVGSSSQARVTASLDHVPR